MYLLSVVELCYTFKMKNADFIPYLMVDDGKKAIEFYSKVFEVEPFVILNMPDGRVMHCEFRVNGAKLFLSDEIPEHGGGPSPKTLKATSVTIHYYVEDCDAVVTKMKAHGAEVVQSPADMFFGERFAQVRDPFGHTWNISTKTKEMSSDEIKNAASALFEESD